MIDKFQIQYISPSHIKFFFERNNRLHDRSNRVVPNFYAFRLSCPFVLFLSLSPWFNYLIDFSNDVALFLDAALRARCGTLFCNCHIQRGVEYPTIPSFVPSRRRWMKVAVGKGHKDLFVGTTPSSRLPLSLHSHARGGKKGTLQPRCTCVCTCSCDYAVRLQVRNGCRALVTPAASYLCLACTGSNSGSRQNWGRKETEYCWAVSVIWNFYVSGRTRWNTIDGSFSEVSVENRNGKKGGKIRLPIPDGIDGLRAYRRTFPGIISF